MDSNNLNVIKTFSTFLIVKVYYNNNGYTSSLYFTNSRVLINSFREKNNMLNVKESIINDTQCCFYDLIGQKDICITPENVKSYLIEDIDLIKFKDLNTLSKSDIYYHKKALIEKIEAIQTQIKQWTDSILYIKEYLNKDLFADRIKLEFEDNITDFNKYINDLAYINFTSINFHTAFLCKKFNITENTYVNSTEEELENFKVKWLEYIKSFTASFVKYLKAEKDALPKDDVDYIKEMEVLITDVENNITEINLSNAKTISQVVETWPALLSPPPFFLG